MDLKATCWSPDAGGRIAVGADPRCNLTTQSLMLLVTCRVWNTNESTLGRTESFLQDQLACKAKTSASFGVRGLRGLQREVVKSRLKHEFSFNW
jgi:hypothetical protein